MHIQTADGTIICHDPEDQYAGEITLNQDEIAELNATPLGEIVRDMEAHYELLEERERKHQPIRRLRSWERA